MPMTIEVIARWDELIDHRHAWLDLLARSSANEPMLSPQWLETWWQIFGEGRELRVVLVYEDGRLIGMAPLLARRVWHRRVVPLRRLELLATGEPEAEEIYSEYLNVISEQGQESRVARALVAALRDGELGPWDELVLDMLDTLSPMTRALLHELRRARLLDQVTPHEPCPYIPLPATWEEYLGRMSSSRRYFIKRTLKAFEQWAGKELVLERATTPAELEQGIEILIDLHGERWQREGSQGVFSSARFTRFHRAVMPRLLASENLDLIWVCKGERPLAAAYNIVWDNKVYFYQSGRCTDVPSKVRPGIAIHIYAIQEAIRRGRSKYDFLAGAMRYKQQLALAQTRLIRIRAARSGSLAAGAHDLAERGVDLARLLLRRQPAAGTRARSAEDDE
jgi:CelD/BcsL family acetyltransferase involved in cellulose biosynthesis